MLAVASGSAFTTFVSRQPVCKGSNPIVMSKFNANIIVEELCVCTDVAKVYSIKLVLAVDCAAYLDKVVVVECWL